jgi:signal peptidase II
MNTENARSQNNTRAKLYFLIIFLISFGLSQLSGFLVNENLAISESYEINQFLYLTHIRNHGGVFGSFHGKGWVFAIISIGILSVLCVYLFLSKNVKTYEYICFGFIVGAGCSNIADRFIYGSVIDYINVQGIPYWHYVFNTADTFIHVGVWPMILFTFLDAKSEVNKKQSNTK